MSYITTSKASAILEVSKKTLFRWDKAGKFSPSIREQISKGRVYKEQDVLNLKTLLNHEERYQRNLKQIRKVQKELNPYTSSAWLSNKEGELLDREKELIEEHEKLVKEFENFSQAIKILYKKFFMS